MTTCAPATLDEAVSGAIQAALDGVLTVERKASTRTPSGGWTDAWSPVPGLVDVPCRIRPSGGGEMILADRLGFLDAYTVVVPHATDIRTADELVSQGLRFRVQWVPQVDDGLERRLIATVIG